MVGHKCYTSQEVDQLTFNQLFCGSFQRNAGGYLKSCFLQQQSTRLHLSLNSKRPVASRPFALSVICSIQRNTTTISMAQYVLYRFCSERKPLIQSKYLFWCSYRGRINEFLVLADLFLHSHPDTQESHEKMTSCSNSFSIESNEDVKPSVRKLQISHFKKPFNEYPLENFAI